MRPARNPHERGEDSTLTEVPALTLSEISKRFGAVQAVSMVSITCRPGEIHAIVGENGSGKSTLLGMASGIITPDEGHVTVGGKRLRGAASHQARSAGVAMVFQTRSLAPDLTVGENLFASVSQGQIEGNGPGSYGERDAWARKQLDRFGLAVDVHARTGDLSIGQQQMLEIIKALVLRPRVLMLDEPTTALDPAQISQLHHLISGLVADGGSVMYVSHRLEEILSVSHRVTVMRDGKSQGTFGSADVTEADLIALMVGGKKADLGPATAPEKPVRAAVEVSGPAVLTVRGLISDGLGPIDLDLQPGEIVGIAGADGNGQKELLEALSGLRPAKGTLACAGTTFTNGTIPKRALKAGIMLLPGDRLGESLVPALGIRANATLNSLEKFSIGGFIRANRERDAVSALAARLKVRTPSLDQPVRLLSGGNQQKVVLARPFLRGVKVLLADEPTQGVDVQSRLDIYAALREKSDAGAAVIVKSSDPIELAEICDRVLVMSRGQVIRELQGEALTEHGIVSAFVGSTDSHREHGHTDHAAHPSSSAVIPRGSRWSGVLPFALLGVLTLLLGGYAAANSPTFLSAYNLNSLLLSALPLALVAVAQVKVLVAGGFDISVGLTATLSLVVSSFVLASDSAGSMLFGIPLILAIGAAIGFFNGLLVTRLNLPPIVVTIATLSLVQGVSLILRPVPGGTISQGFMDALSAKVGFLPAGFLAVAAAAIAADAHLRRSRRGLETRFTGLDLTSAQRIGIRTKRVQLSAYVVAAVLSSVAGMFLAPQVGIGDPTVGGEYALASVAAAVLGGASLSGGRGSYIGAVWAAVFLSLVNNVSPLLGWTSSISLTTSGALTLLALLLYSLGGKKRSTKRTPGSQVPAASPAQPDLSASALAAGNGPAALEAKRSEQNV
jgi:ribose transport system ATP-binding protein